MRYKSIIFILLILTAVHFVTGPVLSNLYNKNGERLLGMPTSVQKISFDLLNCMITVKGLKVSGVDKNDLVAIDSAIIDFKLLPLLSKKMRFTELSANGVRLNLSADGERLLRLITGLKEEEGTRKIERPDKDFEIKKGKYGFDVVYTAGKRQPAVTFDTINFSNLSVDFAPAEDRTTPPALSEINIRIRNFTPEPVLSENDTEFAATGRIKDQISSFLELTGSYSRKKEGLASSAKLRAHNIALPDLWPFITEKLGDPDLATLIVNSGTADVDADVRTEDDDTTIRAAVKFRKFNISSFEAHHNEPLAGKNRKVIIAAINSVSDFTIEFSDSERWKKAFNEVVMKGVRNLIRQKIRETLFG